MVSNQAPPKKEAERGTTKLGEAQEKHITLHKLLH